MGVFEQLRLEGKVALVTGASKGIGAELARAYAEAGADLALVARNRDDLERVAASVRERGRRALVLPADLTDLAAIPPLVAQTVAEFGHLDVLVNAAGINRRLPVLEVSPADWDFVVNTNLRSVFFMCQAAGRHMVARQSGKIVNFASTNTFRSFPDLSLYALTKAAISRLTATLAVEWAPYNIQVNAIAPGWVDTPMTATMASERKRWVDQHVPAGRFGTTAEVAGLGLFLASPASNYATGQTFVVDGGFLAGSGWV
ncbi:MAG: glucose 1-dehydrogenase [Chloroflexi bacterium]|nr:glucose 1-dehydrogenase [Chloroflexota bacterium]